MAFGGIRDRELRPSGCRVSAWQMAADNRTLTLWVPMPPQFRERFFDALLDNRQFAATIEEHPAHETYQLKGTYLKHRDAVPGDLDIVVRHRERLARVLRIQVPPGMDVQPLLRIILPDPTYVLDIDVREVYLQTPGPGAGSRIHPPAEADRVA